MSSERADARPSHGAGRRALLDAAVRVVAQKGLRGLTYRAVATEAGVTYGLVSHHFGSRAGMVLETLSFAARESMAASFLNRPTPAIDDIGAGVAERAAAMADEHAFTYEMLLEARRNPELADDMRSLYADYVRMMQRQLAEAGVDDDPALARVIFAAIDGLVLQQLLDGDASATDRATEALRRLLEDAAAHRARPN